MSNEVLRGQLQNHWTGAGGGVAFFQRVARTHPDPEVAAEVGAMAVEVAEDREALRQIMLSLGITPSRLGTLTGRGIELVGRLKPNGRIVTRAPLTDVVELETLRTAVAGKRSGMQVLRALADRDPRIDPHQIDRILARTEAHLERLERLHVRVAMDRIAEAD